MKIHLQTNLPIIHIHICICVQGVSKKSEITTLICRTQPKIDQVAASGLNKVVLLPMNVLLTMLLQLVDKRVLSACSVRAQCVLGASSVRAWTVVSNM